MCVQKERSVCNRGGFVVDPDRWHGVHARRENEIFSIFRPFSPIFYLRPFEFSFFVSRSLLGHPILTPLAQQETLSRSDHFYSGVALLALATIDLSHKKDCST